LSSPFNPQEESLNVFGVGGGIAMTLTALSGPAKMLVLVIFEHMAQIDVNVLEYLNDSTV
jgi:hypothetical protein